MTQDVIMLIEAIFSFSKHQCEKNTVNSFKYDKKSEKGTNCHLLNQQFSL